MSELGGHTDKPTATYAHCLDDDEEMQPGGIYPVRCTAARKSSDKREDKHGKKGDRCKKRSVPGRRVCKFHGGHAGRPIKTGRYSKGLGKFSRAYEEARANPEDLLDLTETLALLDLAVGHYAERLGQSDTHDFRERLAAMAKAYKEEEDPDEKEMIFDEMHVLIDKGCTDDEALAQLTKASERMSIRQEKAWGVRLQAHSSVNAKDLRTVLTRIASIFMEECAKDGQTEIADRAFDRFDRELMEGNTQGRINLALSNGDPLP